jgi:site-specific recombinase XerD
VTIRSGKNGKSRLVPLHDTATGAVAGYLRDRDRLCPEPARSQALLISPPGSRLLYCNVHATWRKLAAAAGLRPRSGNCRPRIHDLRHAFAAALQHPEHAETIARVLAIPAKKFDRALVTWLTEPEVSALLAAPNKATWAGRRDHAMLALAAQAGLRVSELTGLTCGDVHLGTGPHASCHGKGRKQRITPLATVTVAVLRAWLAERHGERGQPLFPNRTGGRLSRDAVEKRLALHATAAADQCLSLKAKNVTAHTLRHTAAMRLLRAGVDTSVIALWLGHEQADTTQIYLHADLELKEKALARTAPANTAPGRYKPPDQLLAFLESL